MCRILLVRSAQPFSIEQQLQPFAQLSENSQEYQGHSWGCCWLDTDHSGQKCWRHYHCIDPVWQDDLQQFCSTRLLLVHARSAFRDEGIRVENNMPFSDGRSVFVFNGELRGVRINSEGRIGAEKIYNYIRRMDKGDLFQATHKAVSIIDKRSRYVRAMNIFLSDGESSVLSTRYNEDSAYFQLHRLSRNGLDKVCSQPFPGETDWQPVANNTTLII